MSSRTFEQKREKLETVPNFIFHNKTKDIVADKVVAVVIVDVVVAAFVVVRAAGVATLMAISSAGRFFSPGAFQRQQGWG